MYIYIYVYVYVYICIYIVLNIYPPARQTAEPSHFQR